MENATKALIIAAAVLVAILIISLGIGVFTSASEQMGDMDLSGYEIKKFNEKFEKYLGENVRGSKVNALLETVYYHNQSYSDNSEKHMRVRVGLNGGGHNNGKDKSDTEKWLIMREQFYEKPDIQKLPIVNNYRVEAKYDAKTKLIYEIQVYDK